MVTIKEVEVKIQYLIPHWVEAIVMDGTRAGFECVRWRRTMQVDLHIGVNNLTLLGSTGLGQVAGRDHINHQLVPLRGLGYPRVDHVVRFEHIARRAVLQKFAEVNVVGQVSGLVVQRHQLAARRPGSHGDVVRGINAGALGVDTTVNIKRM